MENLPVGVDFARNLEIEATARGPSTGLESCPLCTKRRDLVRAVRRDDGAACDGALRRSDCTCDPLAIRRAAPSVEELLSPASAVQWSAATQAFRYGRLAALGDAKIPAGREIPTRPCDPGRLYHCDTV